MQQRNLQRLRFDLCHGLLLGPDVQQPIARVVRLRRRVVPGMRFDEGR